MNFWQEMKKPIICLAPMADVTDSAFRFIIAKYSKKLPRGTFWDRDSSKVSLGNGKVFDDSFVIWTEFVSADGLVKAPEEGKKKLLKDLEFDEIERPIVAQFFTSKPEMMEEVAYLATMLGFDGVDINMGCPDKSIEKQNAGASLIKNPKLAREIIRSAKVGALRGAKEKFGDQNLAIPVSVKTRLGYNKDELETWLPELLAENPAVITLHARTRKEMSKVPARWERIKRAVEIRDGMQNFPSPQSHKCTDILLLENSDVAAQSSSQGVSEIMVSKNSDQFVSSPQKTLIIGNGDVESLEDAKKKCEESGADGIMIGRGVFGNPWFFAGTNPTKEDKIKVLAEHIKLFDEKLGDVKSFAVMKKHFKAYLNDPSLKKLRVELMNTKDAKEAEQKLLDFLEN